MAEVYTTLADLVKINDANVNDLGISDLFDDAPLVKRLSSTVASSGTNHSYLKQTGAPSVGFRAVNTGRENSASADTQVNITLKLLDASFSVDMGLAKAYKKGVEAYLAREAKRHLKQAWFETECQLVYGTGNDSAGFAGLANASTLDGLADVGTVVNAGGTTANTASSIYLIRSNDDGRDLQMVVGNDGEIVIDQSVVTTIGDASSRFTAYHTPIMGYMGLQIGSAVSVVRICNITGDSGKGATDALIATALSLFPASRQPNLMAMSRRSLKQLQQSRTATNATGAPAPFPVESFGVPIVVTDAIGNTEALVA